MAGDILLYIFYGFAAALLIFLFVKIVFGRNVKTIDMSVHYRSGPGKGKEMKEKVKELLSAGNRGKALEFVKTTGNLNDEQSEKLVNFIGNLDRRNFDYTDLDTELIERVKKLIKEKNTFEAVKLITQSDKMTLSNAKKIIDQIKSQNETGIDLFI
ncbi:MAG: hypothetical protein JSS91_11745 [Bacteroidetes bacterium]|nr:hypothetical protein [Bacteroidota bacterium]